MTFQKHCSSPQRELDLEYGSPVCFHCNTKRKDRRLKLGEITMYFEAYGSGEPLILTHGRFDSADVLTDQMPDFSEHYHVIAPDSRGQGRTTDSDGPFSYHLMADDVIWVLDYLGIGSAYIAGWSDGSITGIALAINYPARVKTLVAFGTNLNPNGYQDDFLEHVRKATLKDIKQMVGSD